MFSNNVDLNRFTKRSAYIRFTDIRKYVIISIL